MAATYHAILTWLYSLSQCWQMHFKQMHACADFAIHSNSSSIKAHDVSSGRACLCHPPSLIVVAELASAIFPLCHLPSLPSPPFFLLSYESYPSMKSYPGNCGNVRFLLD